MIYCGGILPLIVNVFSDGVYFLQDVSISNSWYMFVKSLVNRALERKVHGLNLTVRYLIQCKETACLRGQLSTGPLLRAVKAYSLSVRSKTKQWFTTTDRARTVLAHTWYGSNF